MEFWYSAIRAVEALRVPYNGALLLLNAARNAAVAESAVSWYTKEKGYPIQYGFVASCSEETPRLLLQEVAATPAVIPYHERDCFILRDPGARALYEAAHVVWTGE